MTTTARETKVYDIAALTDFAIRHGNADTFTFDWIRVSPDQRSYHLTVTGGTSYRRDRLYVTTEIGERLAALWKRNEYSRFVGAKSLKRIIKDLSGTDIGPAVKAAEAKAIADGEARRQRAMRCNEARALRACLDVLNQATPEVREGRAIVTGPMRTLLNALTYFERDAALAVAYDGYGTPRGDD